MSKLKTEQPQPQITPSEYSKEGGTRCPMCKSHDITGSSIDIAGQFAYQQIDCNDCSASWTDVYILDHYSELTTA